MRIKRYEAPTIQEALQKVKKDLGPDAVILYTKTFRKGGVLGLFGKTMAEITAGIDLNLLDDLSRRKAPSAPVPVAVTSREEVSAAVTAHSAGSPMARTSSPTLPSEPIRPKVKALQRELNEMKTSTISNILRDMAPSDTALLSEGFTRLRKKLQKQEVEDLIIQRILKGLVEERVDPERAQDVSAWLVKFIARSVRLAPPLVFGGFPKVLAFVGPTGVGKTTTLAKLSAKYGLLDRKRVALVTADTYRIAATEQLKTYGRIMGIPVEVADSPDDMVDILAKHKTIDLILLDTAGRSPSNDQQLDELKHFIFRSQPDEIHLVLSATTKYVDMLRIIERFGSAVPINRLIFTKLDETRYYGAFLNLMTNFQIPLAFCATGQNVPDDLEVPEMQALAEKIAQAILS